MLGNDGFQTGRWASVLLCFCVFVGITKRFWQLGGRERIPPATYWFSQDNHLQFQTCNQRVRWQNTRYMGSGGSLQTGKTIIYVISQCCHLKVRILIFISKNQTPLQPLAALLHLYAQLVRRSKLLDELQARCNHLLLFFLLSPVVVWKPPCALSSMKSDRGVTWYDGNTAIINCFVSKNILSNTTSSSVVFSSE